MGDLSGEGYDNERPVHTVTVRPFRLGKYEVTFAQWDACVASGGCPRGQIDSSRSDYYYLAYDEGWGRGNRPVINVSWNHAQLYIDWLNARTGGGYRLPTEAEWEYAARAGSTTKYPWGNDLGSNRANCLNDFCGDNYDYTAPVGSFPANAWGLHDMHGNVHEWVQDCWRGNYEGAPTDGSARTSNCYSGLGYNHPYSRRTFRGGSWSNSALDLRSARRARSERTDKAAGSGFRVAQDN